MLSHNVTMAIIRIQHSIQSVLARHEVPHNVCSKALLGSSANRPSLFRHPHGLALIPFLHFFVVSLTSVLKFSLSLQTSNG